MCGLLMIFGIINLYFVVVDCKKTKKFVGVAVNYKQRERERERERERKREREREKYCYTNDDGRRPGLEPKPRRTQTHGFTVGDW